MYRLTDEERREMFWSRAMPEPNTGCWLWTGVIRRDGYGVFSDRAAHRIAYAERHGPIPAGLYVCHRCDVKSCVNPDHLFLGTARENTLDMLAKGRCRAGWQNKEKTRCDHGHEFNAENTYRHPNGTRKCRACMRAAGRAYKSRRLALADPKDAA
jgi:hypothetical protein